MITSITRGTPTPPLPDEARLRAVAQQLEGVFVEQLFKAMRETVPEGGFASGGAGEDMFNGLMDQHLAAEVPGQWTSPMTEALLNRFRATIPPPTSEPR